MDLKSSSMRKNIFFCHCVSRSVGGYSNACRSSKRQCAGKIHMPDLWVAHCKLYRDSVSITSGAAFFYFHVLIYDWNLWITMSEPKLTLGAGLYYKPFHLQWTDWGACGRTCAVCDEGHLPFVVRTPLNIFHRINYHTICSFLPVCCSLSACQYLFSPFFSRPLSHWE